MLVGLSNSGGPLTSTVAVFLAWAAWLLRGRMSLVRRATFALLLLLVVAMKAPIWYLPFKISSIVGGGGYHRGLVMDQAWQDLGKWWLFGMDISGTAEWVPYVHSVVGGADVTNQFVVFGLRGGLLAVVISVAVFVFSFRSLGHVLGAVRRSVAGNGDELLCWGLGAALFVHAVSWFGVSYFDQSYLVWLLHLAAISSSAQERQLGSAEAVSPPVTGRPPVRTAAGRSSPREASTAVGRDAAGLSRRDLRLSRAGAHTTHRPVAW